MKATKNHQKTLERFRESSFVKMATKFLLSVSVFSVIFSYSSLLPFLLHSFNFSYTAYSKEFLGYSIDKNYMFLLCNGILVFIVKNSGIIGKSPEENDFTAKNGVRNRDSRREVVKLSEMKESILEEKLVEGAEDTENVLSVAQDDEEKEQENKSLIVPEEEEEEEEEEGIGLLSVEELNKKCDDFIRRMKLEIKVEAQQLLMF
ncbi:Transmembrane protein [Melia azedarach]|uniref:Transmembrane protein n=1 Tax=Melia azedarach TaxID=155640 RepID=A0ACC1Z3Z8_MELAZ|nr:Transmembrane protein [Melia azedarach]